MKKYFIVVSLLVVLSLVLTGMADAASTIGTNMSTTGTFTQTVSSATAARFQNAAGTLTVLQVDTNTGTGRVGVGAAPSTTFEVQGTASASFFYTGNTIQVGGGTNAASVAYNRFGSTATTQGLSAVNDVLINGKLEVDGNVFFDTEGGVGVGGATGTVFEVQGTASASFFYTGNTIQVGGGTNAASVAYNRFGSTATTHAANITTTNDVVINGDFEVDSKAFFDGTASVADAFEATNYASAAQGFFQTDIVVNHNVASSSSVYVAEFGGGAGTATVSLLFGSSTAASRGTCLQLKDDAGNWVYARVAAGGSTFTVNRIKCHN